MALRTKARGLVLVAGTPRFLEDENHGGTAPVVLRAMRMRVVSDRAACQYDFFRSTFLPADDANAVNLLCREACELPAETLVCGLDFLARTDLRAEVGRITVPLKVIHGEQDSIVPYRAAERFAAKVPGSTYDVLPGVGHALPLLAPTEVARAIAHCVDADR
jgi:pimeloyl-[acyl-carrier protein] methyl ester esterase